MTTIDIDIDALLQPLGPFERPPILAAAISGGSDSTALGLLLADWIAQRGGHLHVLSVDHGLRPEAGAECAAVARRFQALPRCSAEILTWQGAKPATGLQQAAREGRFRLMTDWCRARGILHLALGHTADDQAETVAMRRDHGSSALGLAAMPAVTQRDGVRLLRPLLGVTRAELRACLTARGEGWTEDPSNDAAQFERVRQRAALAASGESGALLAGARRDGVARDAAERDAARFLARAAKLAPEGWLGIDLVAWHAAAPQLRTQVLRQTLLAVGGHAYPPAPDAVQRLADSDPSQITGTLAGCILASRQGQLVLCREAGDIRHFPEITPGWSGRWDERFALAVAADLAPGALAIRPLGEEGQRQAARLNGISLKRHPVPAAARAALPALWRGEQVLAQPHLALGHGLTARLAPRHNATTCGFTVAVRPPHTMYSSFPG
jgi:tRNA(Ile)-lysidine synthase